MGRLAQTDFDDEEDMDSGDEVGQAAIDVLARLPPDKVMAHYEEMLQSLAVPDEWGKKGKRPVAVSPGVRKRVSNGLYEVTKGYHKEIPLEGIFLALAQGGLVPVQEDGHRWSGMLVGGAECGSTEAASQHAELPLATRGSDGKWSLTTTVLSLRWCKMSVSGNYEITCYLA
jgi:hypothetical protein